MNFHPEQRGNMANAVLIDIDSSRRGETDIYLFNSITVESDSSYDFEEGFTQGGEFFRIYVAGVRIEYHEQQEVAQRIDDFIWDYEIYDDFLDDDNPEIVEMREKIYNGITKILYEYRGIKGLTCKCLPVRNGNSPRPRPCFA